MNIKIDTKKLEKKDFNFESELMLFDFIKQKIEWLASHNRNYTKEQCFILDDLKEILSCCELEEFDSLTPPRQN